MEVYFYKADGPGVLSMATVPGTLKERNGKDLTEAEEIKKGVARIQRTIQKGLNDLDNHNGVVIHLEPDILECQVK